MQDKKIIILIVLSIFAVISVLHGVMAPPKHKYSTATNVSGAQSANTQPATHMSMKRHAKRTQFKSWKRSPFAPAGSGTSSTLVLNGIIWSKDRPKAMIGDAIVTKGSMVNGNKVVDITSNKVILNDGANNFELKMEK